MALKACTEHDIAYDDGWGDCPMCRLSCTLRVFNEDISATLASIDLKDTEESAEQIEYLKSINDTVMTELDRM
jgi:hypothetical protein